MRIYRITVPLVMKHPSVVNYRLQNQVFNSLITNDLFIRYSILGRSWLLVHGSKLMAQRLSVVG